MSFKEMWQSQFALLLRAFVIVLIARYYLNDDFSLENDLFTSFATIFVGFIVFVLADVLSLRGDSTYLTIEDNLIKKIRNEMTTHFTTIDSQRGIFIETFRLENDKPIKVFIPLDKPYDYIQKSIAYRSVLSTLKSAAADRLISDLERYQTEAEYMIYHEDDKIFTNSP